MKQGRTRIITIAIIGALLFSPLTASAQYQSFNPNATLQMNGNTFGGIQFSGVGGAIASCTNFGGTVTKLTNKAVGSISNLFRSGSGTVTGSAAAPNLSQSAIDNHINSITGGSTRQDAAGAAGVSLPVGSSTVPVTDTETEKQLQESTKREECLDGVAYAVAKSLLQQVTEKVVSMVNTGNFGNPYYVRDLPSYLKTINDEQTNRFLQSIPNDDPIFGNAIRSIVTEQVTGVSDGLLSKSMNTPQGQAYQQFQEDFSNGGWEAFLDPNNNPINSIFNAADKLNNSIATQEQDVKDQLQRNGGFLDMRRCVEYAPVAVTYPYTFTPPNTTDTYSCTKDLTAQYRDDYATCATGVVGSTEMKKCQDALSDVYSTTSSDVRKYCVAQSTLTDDPQQCLSWETVTPGSVISAQINAVTTSPIRVLENSDKMSNNIDQIFGSIFDNVLNWLYNQGLGSLRGRGGNNAFTLGTQGQNIVIGSNGQPIASSNAQNILGYSPSGNGVSSTDFDVSRPQQIRTVLKVQYDYLNRAADSQIAEQRILPVLGALDYCIPGPNPTWQDGLTDNVKAYAGSLQVEGTDGSGAGTGGKIGSAVGAVAGSIIPGVGTAIGSAIGNVLGSLVGGIIDDGKPHALLTNGVTLYDKVTAAPVVIRNTTWREKGHSPGAIYDNIQKRVKEVVDSYSNSFNKDAITKAFIAVDPTNTAYVKGFIDTSFTETSKLAQYDQELSKIDDDYTTQISNTKDAIKELESIQDEVNGIVSKAKARYVQQQKDAGTPVNETCLNNAYSIDSTPITPAARVESDTPSPYLNQSLQGASYFYSHL